MELDATTPGGSMDTQKAAAVRVVAGCRQSELALVQARHVVTRLSESVEHSAKFEVATKSVAGDADKDTPFLLLSKQTGGSDVGKSLWTNGLEVDLLGGKFDFLVHCLKDMPTTLPPSFTLGAITEREDPSDAVVMKAGSDIKLIDQLPPGAVVGSSSSRRKALIHRNWPHLQVAECRGNIDTRLSKLDAADSPYSCILLATAGLVRLGLGHRITQRLDPDVFPYAVGQGALGIEICTDRQDMQNLISAANHPSSRWRGLGERAMLRHLQGGCSSPVGVFSSFETSDEQAIGHTAESVYGLLTLHATVLDVSGTTEIRGADARPVRNDGDAEELGISVARMLLEQGASRLLHHDE